MAKRKTRKQTCSQCKGDGIWHSTKTGIRAKTASRSLVDENKECPECKGKGVVFVPLPPTKAEIGAKAKAQSQSQSQRRR